MPSEHARLSPSSAERWISCPASVRAIERLEPRDEPESTYAREGTLAHTLGELRAGRRFGHLTEAEFLKAHGAWQGEVEAEFPDGTVEDMEHHIVGYVDLLERLADDRHSVVFLEQRLPTGVPESWGTSDAVVVSPSHINIVDLKYGAGVPVRAEGNPQLRLYALGALDAYDGLLGDAETITMTVYQPRVDNVSHETLTVAELLMWRREVAIPAARKALYEPWAPYGPSDGACRWCPLAGVCRPRTEWATRRDFGDITSEADPSPVDPPTLTPVEIGRVLPRLKRVTSWAKDVEAAALDLAYAQGEAIPGYKVVRSGGRRQIKDDTAAIQHLIDLGFTAEQVADFKIKGFGILEKALGKDTVSEALAEFITMSPGREALVPESDKRPAITSAGDAASDFASSDSSNTTP